MKKLLFAVVVLFSLAVSARGGIFEKAASHLHDRLSSTSVPANGTIEVVFSPNGGGTAAVVRFIGEAKKSIRVATYSFTSNEIGQALIAAKRRGVDVQVVVDRDHNGKRTSGNSVAGYLAASGIPVRVDRAVKIQHNKTVVIDQSSVLNGSMNFSAAGNKDNRENLTIHRGAPELASLFEKNWNSMWAESEPLTSRY